MLQYACHTQRSRLLPDWLCLGKPDANMYMVKMVTMITTPYVRLINLSTQFLLVQNRFTMSSG